MHMAAVWCSLLHWGHHSHALLHACSLRGRASKQIIVLQLPLCCISVWVQAVLRWGKESNVTEEWIQTFVDASYAAMRASVRVMATEAEDADTVVQVGRDGKSL